MVSRLSFGLVVVGIACMLMVMQQHVRADAGGSDPETDPSQAIPGVVQLTPENFDKYVDGSRGVLVEFYAPWCGHCKNLVPTLKKLGAAYNANPQVHGDILIAKVDADKHRDLGGRFEVKGFPTLKFFPKGETKPVDYEGGREADDFAGYFRTKANVILPIPRDVSFVTEVDKSNFESVIAQQTDKCRFLAAVASWCGHCKSMKPAYNQFGKAFINEGKNVIVARVDAAVETDIAQKLDVKGYPSIFFYPRGSSQPEPYNGGRTAAEFTNFVNSRCGTHRTETGALEASVGKIEAFDNFAKSIASGGDAQQILKDAQYLASSNEYLNNQDADYYVRVIERIANKGADYASKEHARLDRMVSGSSVSADKADSMQRRLNILSSFLAA
jgi:protein disulfide-isomerase A6